MPNGLPLSLPFPVGLPVHRWKKTCSCIPHSCASFCKWGHSSQQLHWAGFAHLWPPAAQGLGWQGTAADQLPALLGFLSGSSVGPQACGESIWDCWLENSPHSGTWR